MTSTTRRIVSDIRQLRNVDLYAISFATIVIAVLSLFGDVLPVNLRWAAALVGISALLFRLTLPESSASSADDYLMDRSGYDLVPFANRIKEATDLRILAPSAVNLLSPQNWGVIRSTILDKAGGRVRVIVLDPSSAMGVELAGKQLDDKLPKRSDVFRDTLNATVGWLERMVSWNVNGQFEYRLANFSPGFSLVAIDADSRNGIVMVEFQGYHNDTPMSRMHIELKRKDSERWYQYWLDQFELVWAESVSREGSKP